MAAPTVVTITGGAGQIGYALLFRIASGAMFGPDRPVELRILEITPALKSAQGVIMELDDCAFPLLSKVTASDDPKVAFKDCNWALLVGGKPRGKGMERNDLIRDNGPIFAGTGRAIGEVAAADVRVCVVANPCNTNCLITMRHAPHVPRERFSAMMRLDQNRAVSQLAQKAGVGVAQVKNVTIWGNHSATQFPDFVRAKINGKPATEVITDRKWLETEFIPIVQKRGAAVIEARGSSSAASAANALVDHVKALNTATPAGETFSAAVVSDGSYGADEGLITSFPLRASGDGKWEIVKGQDLEPFSKAKIDASLAELRQEREVVKDLLAD